MPAVHDGLAPVLPTKVKLVKSAAIKRIRRGPHRTQPSRLLVQQTGPHGPERYVRQVDAQRRHRKLLRLVPGQAMDRGRVGKVASHEAQQLRQAQHPAPPQVRRRVRALEPEIFPVFPVPRHRAVHAHEARVQRVKRPQVRLVVVVKFRLGRREHLVAIALQVVAVQPRGCEQARQAPAARDVLDVKARFERGDVDVLDDFSHGFVVPDYGENFLRPILLFAVDAARGPHLLLALAHFVDEVPLVHRGRGHRRGSLGGFSRELGVPLLRLRCFLLLHHHLDIFLFLHVFVFLDGLLQVLLVLLREGLHRHGPDVRHQLPRHLNRDELLRRLLQRLLPRRDFRNLLACPTALLERVIELVVELVPVVAAARPSAGHPFHQLFVLLGQFQFVLVAVFIRESIERRLGLRHRRLLPRVYGVDGVDGAVADRYLRGRVVEGEVHVDDVLVDGGCRGPRVVGCMRRAGAHLAVPRGLRLLLYPHLERVVVVVGCIGRIGAVLDLGFGARRASVVVVASGHAPHHGAKRTVTRRRCGRSRGLSLGPRRERSLRGRGR